MKHIISSLCSKSKYIAVIPSLMLASCGDVANPDAVGLDELKPPKGLQITDLGEGSVTLTWRGGNVEEAFDGYNIYGAKLVKGEAFSTAVDASGLREGDSLQLLDNSGDAIAEAKTLLQTMAYNGTDLEPADTTKDDDIEFLPIYTNKDQLPTCIPDTETGTSACSEVTSAQARHIFNGTSTYQVNNLKVGAKYCFLVFSSMKEGKSISQNSSEFRCVVPKFKTNLDISGLTTSKHQELNLANIRTSCTSEAGCTASTTDHTGFCTANDDVSTCIEYDKSKIGITSAKNTALLDLGYYENGFNEENLPKAPKISALQDLQNENGYNISGQTLALEANHMYVVAVGTEDTPSSFYYDFIYASKVSHVAGTASLELRLSNSVDQQ